MLPKPPVTASLRHIILSFLGDQLMYEYEIIQRVHSSETVRSYGRLNCRFSPEILWKTDLI